MLKIIEFNLNDAADKKEFIRIACQRMMLSLVDEKTKAGIKGNSVSFDSIISFCKRNQLKIEIDFNTMEVSVSLYDISSTEAIQSVKNTVVDSPRDENSPKPGDFDYLDEEDEDIGLFIEDDDTSFEEEDEDVEFKEPIIDTSLTSDGREEFFDLGE